MPNLINSPECRFVPSQADVAAFDSLKGACPDKAKYPHAARWYKHIESFEAAGKPTITSPSEALYSQRCSELHFMLSSIG